MDERPAVSEPAVGVSLKAITWTMYWPAARPEMACHKVVVSLRATVKLSDGEPTRVARTS